MKFRYYILDPFESGFVGTNSLEVASEFAKNDDFYVIDAEAGTELYCGVASEIKEVAEIK